MDTEDQGQSDMDIPELDDRTITIDNVTFKLEYWVHGEVYRLNGWFGRACRSVFAQATNARGDGPYLMDSRGEFVRVLIIDRNRFYRAIPAPKGTR